MGTTEESKKKKRGLFDTSPPSAIEVARRDYANKPVIETQPTSVGSVPAVPGYDIPLRKGIPLADQATPETPEYRAAVLFDQKKKERELSRTTPAPTISAELVPATVDAIPAKSPYEKTMGGVYGAVDMAISDRAGYRQDAGTQGYMDRAAGQGRGAVEMLQPFFESAGVADLGGFFDKYFAEEKFVGVVRGDGTRSGRMVRTGYRDPTQFITGLITAAGALERRGFDYAANQLSTLAGMINQESVNKTNLQAEKMKQEGATKRQGMIQPKEKDMTDIVWKHYNKLYDSKVAEKKANMESTRVSEEEAIKLLAEARRIASSSNEEAIATSSLTLADAKQRLVDAGYTEVDDTGGMRDGVRYRFKFNDEGEVIGGEEVE